MNILEKIRQAAYPLTGDETDYQAMLEQVGEAQVVMIGEASHGTHEFYAERARITEQLIKHHGFTAVAVEADFPDAYRVNCYVRGVGDDKNADQALGDFKRFPTWMWRNTVMVNFVSWLQSYNAQQEKSAAKVGFYGLDLYSLYSSIEAVIEYLDKVDPEAAQRARYRYSCLGHSQEDPQAYGYAAAFGMKPDCENNVVTQLVELRNRSGEYIGSDGRSAEEAFFYAEQNARLAINAEEYYRKMFEGRVSSWNLRDQHMVETLDELIKHLSQQQGKPAKVVVWEHNSHLGDARATDMGRHGEWNVGQLVRERYGGAACNIGFTTYTGTVSAASDWGRPVERKRVRPGLSDSYENLFHQVDMPRFWLDTSAVKELRQPRLERAIGVIYLPQSERLSHYFQTTLPDQFDFVIHIDETTALEPLERTPGWDTGEVPDTYPTGI